MKKFLIFLFLLLLMTPRGYAQETYSDDFRYSVQPQYPILDNEISLRDPAEVQRLLDFESLFSWFTQMVKKALGSGMKVLLPGVAAVLLSVWLNYCTSCFSLGGGTMRTVADLILSLSVALIGRVEMESAAVSLQEALESMKVFCSACIPSFSVVMISGGENAGAATFSALMLILGEVGVFVSANLLIPLVHIYLSIGACSAVGDDYNFSSVARQIRRFMIWCIGLFVAGFRLILQLRSGAAGAGDMISKKYIKSAVAGLIPYVGGSLSQGVEGLFSVAVGAKTAFAISGVLILISVLLPSLIVVGIHGLMWSLCRWLASFLNDVRSEKIAEVLSNGYYLMLALGGGVGLMALFSFFGLISGVG